MKKVATRIGENLRELRETKSLTRANVYENTGVALNTQNAIENGTTNPRLSTLFYICEYLEVDIMEIFCIETNEQKTSDTLDLSVNDISQWLQDNGYEEMSKTIDCDFEL